jgi:hypothetical protein
MKPRMLEENGDHFRMHDGKAEFRVPKFGLSPEMHTKIRGMADGGAARADLERQKSRQQTVARIEGPEGLTMDVSEPAIAPRSPREDSPQAGGGTDMHGPAAGYRASGASRPAASGALSTRATHRQSADERVPDLEVQRAHGGAIPGYADGGSAGGGGEQPTRAPTEQDWAQAMKERYFSPFARALEGSRESLPPAMVEQARREGAPWAGGSGAGGGPPDTGQGAVSGGGEGGETMVRPQSAPAPAPAAAATVAPPRTAPVPSKTAARPAATSATAPTLAGAFDRAGINPETPAPAEKSPYELIGEAQAQEARSKVAAIAAAQDQARTIELERKKALEASQMQAKEVLAKHLAQVDENARMSTEIDPGRLWASKSTAGKISTIIGLALGAIGAGADGQNRAAQMLDNAVTRDLEAQKAEHNIRLQRGKAAVEGYQTHYSMARELTNDEQAAFNMAKSSAHENIALEFEKAAATAADPIARQNALAGAAAARQAALKNRLEAGKTLAETHELEARAAKTMAGAKGPAANPGLDAVAAIDRLSDKFKKTGAFSFATKHLPGSAADEYDQQAQTDAFTIATAIRGPGAKPPRTMEEAMQTIKGVVPGSDTPSGAGADDLRNLRRTIAAKWAKGGASAPADPEDVYD